MEVWVQILSTVGFPILAAFACAWFVKYQMDSYKAESKEMREQHKEEINQMTDAINKNTLVIQKLCDKLDCNNDSEGAA